MSQLYKNEGSPALEARAESGHGSASGHTTTGSSNATTTPTTTKRVKHIDYVRTTTGYWYWYIVAAIVGVCAVHNLISLARRHAQRRAGIKRASAPLTVPVPTNGLRKKWHAGEALMSNFFFVRAIPIKLYSGMNITEAIFSIAYIGVCTGLTLCRTYQNGSRRVELEFGMICYVQIPLIVALASRNNIISYLTGISYQKLNILHRAAGRACYIFAWVHAIAYCTVGLGKHGPGTKVFWTGVMALSAFTIATVSSFALARRVMYETFLVLHIIFVTLFLVGCFMHRPNKVLQPWIIAGFVVWGFDRFVGLCRMFVVNKAWLLPLGKKHSRRCSECTVELVSHDIVRLTVPRPLLKWGPGQHALVTMPSVAGLRYEQHPFSFANVPEDKQTPAVFVIRAHSGFTRRLVDHLTETKTTSIQCYLDGPYGLSESYTHHDTVLLVAGGTGITHVLSIFLDIVQKHRKGESAVKTLRLVWNIRHIGDINLIAPLLNSAFSQPIEGLAAYINVHLTRSHASDEPGDIQGLTELLTHGGHSTVPETPMEKTGESTPGAGTSSSASSSNEKLGEKGSRWSDLPKISAQVAEAISFKAGRADIRALLESQVRGAETTMGVSVCGPLSLSLDTRRAVGEVNTAQRVWGGQAKIELSVEKFGW